MAEQAVLRLVARGNSIIAEIRRLSLAIPPALQHPKWKDLFVGFAYLQTPSVFDKKWQADQSLLVQDEEFRTAWTPLIERFYSLWESVYKYWKDLCRFIGDLENGVFVQQTLETLLADTQSCQLIVESVYLYGVILLLMEQRIPGPTREKILILYQRWLNIHLAPSNFDLICRLCADTLASSSSSSSSSSHYPEDYLGRFPLPPALISMVLGKLRTDDIYNQIPFYPRPEHRSVALSTQMSILYIVLYFAPDVLKSDHAKMREIVDKHLPDNWVVSYYMGVVADLSVRWSRYPAAKAALQNTTQSSMVKSMTETHCKSALEMLARLEEYLSEGRMTEEFVLDHIRDLLGCLRDSNASLRWLLLHSHAESSSLQQTVCSIMRKHGIDVVQLLLLVSRFEFQLKRITAYLLHEKLAQWQEYQRQGAERMQELSEYFSGRTPLTRVTRNENLERWFAQMVAQIQALHFDVSATSAGRKIVQLRQALEEVEQFHQMNTFQIETFLKDTRGFLSHMLRLLNMKEEVLITIGVVSDASYAWDLMADYVKPMQEIVRRQPSSVIHVRTVFLKVASVMDLPLMRINEAQSPDLISVSQFYSGELVRYISQVLQIIPACMFEVLQQIIQLHTEKLHEMPTKVEKHLLGEYAMDVERGQLAAWTHSISQFTSGILAMEKTLVGVVEVDPKTVLETGIRVEVSKRIHDIMESSFQFSGKRILLQETTTTTATSVSITEPTELEDKLHRTFLVLRGLHRSFELLQDHLCIYALKIWKEEFSRIISQCEERETEPYRRPSIGGDVVAVVTPSTFLGRIAHELSRLTSPLHTVYHPDTGTWYLRRRTAHHEPVVGPRTMRHLVVTLGPSGITGLCRLMGFQIYRQLRLFQQELLAMDVRDKTLAQVYQVVERELHPLDTLPPNYAKLYPSIMSRFARTGMPLMEVLCRIGHLHQLHRKLSLELDFWRGSESKLHQYALSTLEEAVIATLADSFQQQQQPQHPQINDDGRDFETLVNGHDKTEHSLVSYLSDLSSGNLLERVFPLSLDEMDQRLLPLLLFMVTLAQLGKFSWNMNARILVCKAKTDALDFHAFALGLISLFRQLDAVHTDTFVGYLVQYIRTALNASLLTTATASTTTATTTSTTTTTTTASTYENMRRLVETLQKRSAVFAASIETRLPHSLMALW